ncbi:MAG: hypothetical protein K2H52_12295 [Lachnospiraceae bacterium]|nr:hypothetical protein [Lachnospiraceae bacterium]MDE6185910.1 hypothetical protein [Lachnospiraceae bacterium]MDE7285757.1 hypothetical protein [Lachnospiraceae bacterium]
MIDTKVCVLAGKVGNIEYALLEKYASEGCFIALINKNKELGRMVKEELERLYDVGVFFFHGDAEKEEDKDIFLAAVETMFGRTDYMIWHAN